MALKYIYMGSPQLAATILNKLLESLYPPALVVTQEPKAVGRGKTLQPTPVEALARSEGIPVLATSNVSAPECVSEMAKYEPDLILIAAFGHILKKPVLELPKLFCLNVHASLLPKYRGAAPIQMAIWDGEAQTGVTIQKIVRALDAGDILLKKSLDILPDETSGDLGERLALLGGTALVEAVQMCESGKIVFTPQDHASATVAPKLTREHGQINWAEPASRIRNQIRALQPWPVAESVLDDGTRIKIFGGTVTGDRAGTTPGTIYTDSKTFLKVACGEGTALSLTQIQLENRKKLGIEDFLKAYRGAFPHKKMGHK